MHNFSHSIMFHHFHDEFHHPAQGSLSENDFIKIIDWLAKRYTILDASRYSALYEKGALKNTDICLSFDDALKCQFDIAVPVMKRFGIEAFFFVYSGAFQSDPDKLELHRFFRTSVFSDIDEFYLLFFDKIKSRDPVAFSKKRTSFERLDYLNNRPFYSENDRWFRYLRDEYLTRKQYDKIMSELMKEFDFNEEAAKRILWMSESDVKKLHDEGNVIGLHSFSHPTAIDKLTRSEQLSEYQKNQQHLGNLLGQKPKVMSHPCGKYNNVTLSALKSLDVKLGFRSNTLIPFAKSSLEVPRENHSIVRLEMEK